MELRFYEKTQIGKAFIFQFELAFLVNLRIMNGLSLEWDVRVISRLENPFTLCLNFDVLRMYCVELK